MVKKEKGYSIKDSAFKFYHLLHEIEKRFQSYFLIFPCLFAVVYSYSYIVRPPRGALGLFIALFSVVCSGNGYFSSINLCFTVNIRLSFEYNG